jgi:hypothetical protein
MFTQAITASEPPRASGRERGPAHPGGPSSVEPDRLYVGEREAGHPVILVVGAEGAESMFAPALGGFDWGWPSMGATRRLARALLLDVTGREPPGGIRDALATEELAHFPWAGFSLTGRQLLDWIESRGDAVVDWPAADSAPGDPIACAASSVRDHVSPTSLATRVAGARVPKRGVRAALGSSR